MNKNYIIIIASSMVFFIGLSIGLIILYDIKNNFSDSANDKKEEVIKKIKGIQANLKIKYNEQFPDILKGTMRIISETESFIITEDGKKYLIFPPRPIVYYKDNKVVEGTFVEIRGKIIDESQVSLGSIKPIVSK